jgi:hypothetical protein
LLLLNGINPSRSLLTGNYENYYGTATCIEVVDYNDLTLGKSVTKPWGTPKLTRGSSISKEEEHETNKYEQQQTSKHITSFKFHSMIIK